MWGKSADKEIGVVAEATRKPLLMLRVMVLVNLVVIIASTAWIVENFTFFERLVPRSVRSLVLPLAKREAKIAEPNAVDAAPEPSTVVASPAAPVSQPAETPAEQSPVVGSPFAPASSGAARAIQRDSPYFLPILETGYEQLTGLGDEAAGYGLYSYGILTHASPRSAAFLGEIFKSLPPIAETGGAARAQLNIFYIPTIKGGAGGLADLVKPSRDDLAKLAARYTKEMYDYSMAQAILRHVCNPPAKTIEGLCKGSMSRGPYILTYAKPASSLEPAHPPFLFVDLSDVHPRAYAELIDAFRAVVKQDDVTDDAKIHSLRLGLMLHFPQQISFHQSKGQSWI
jgi:hypothetical protein